MTYEINVALKGVHLFATHERSIRTHRELKRVLKIFIEKFPESEGYHITVSEWNTFGKDINITEFIQED